MLNQPFFQVALPIMVTMLGAAWAAVWSNNKRLDDIIVRLGRLEGRLLALQRKVDAL